MPFYDWYVFVELDTIVLMFFLLYIWTLIHFNIQIPLKLVKSYLILLFSRWHHSIIILFHTVIIYTSLFLELFNILWLQTINRSDLVYYLDELLYCGLLNLLRSWFTSADCVISTKIYLPCLWSKHVFKWDIGCWNIRMFLIAVGFTWKKSHVV